MKIREEPVSAFAIYSEKMKQKKKSKLVTANKIDKSKKSKSNDLGAQKMNEISNILNALAKRSNTAAIELAQKMSKRNHKLKQKVKNDKNPLVSKRITESNKTIENGLNDAKLNKINKKLTKNIMKNKYEIKLVNSNSTTPIVSKSKHKSKKKKLPSAMEITESKRKKLPSAMEITESVSHIVPESDKYIVQSPGPNQASCNGDAVNKLPVANASNDNVSNNLLKPDKSKKRLSKSTLKNRKTETPDWRNQENSILTAKCLFEWVILPISEKEFMEVYWEKRPLLVQRDSNRNYFSELLSTPVIDSMLRDNVVYFNKHLDVTSYTDGVRETHNLTGRAQANVVWDFYSNGCSVRLLNPQAFIPQIHTLNATLQEYFGCFVGANVYLTPPNSQGFAPHYDDIEAFVLQIEGKKHWKVYSPRNEKETLPRLSSPNFGQAEIGKPLLDVTLEPGDMLYFPRGFIHQAATVDGEHSLHITLSAYQKTAWVDLLEKTLPVALKKAAEEDVEFRQGLPRNYLGLEFHGSDDAKSCFMSTAQGLLAKLGHFLQLTLGAGVDQMGAQFMHSALPPVLTPDEKTSSGLGGGLTMREGGTLAGRVDLQLSSQVKLIRANVCRLVEEENEVRLYHCLDNPLEYEAEEPQFLVLPPDGVPVIEFLLRMYPVSVEVKRLPHQDEDSLLTLVSDLWDAGLLIAKDLQTTTED